MSNSIEDSHVVGLCKGIKVETGAEGRCSKEESSHGVRDQAAVESWEHGPTQTNVSRSLSTSTLSDSTAPSSPPTSSSSFCLDVQRIEPTSNTPDFYLASSPGRQIGLFASRTLRRGELILSESPLLTVSYRSAISSAVAALPSDAQSAFYALSNAYKDEEPEPGIFDTNGFSLSSASSSSPPSFGIFPLTSRLNHSCVPNVKASYDPLSRRMRTHVLRTIDPGEELFTAYLGRRDLYGLESCRRRERLKKGWNFDCRCEVCAATATADEGAQMEASDRRRRRLGELRRDAAAGVRPRDVERVLRECGEALKLLEEERICLDGDEFALAAARACAFAQDYASARIWALVGWKSAREEYGGDGELAKRLAEVVREPRKLLPPGLKGERRELGTLTGELLGTRIELDCEEGESLLAKVSGRLRGLFVRSPNTR
ncbi:hypothetical protein JCM1840_004091 [Sporobolomyces johnsonii]